MKIISTFLLFLIAIPVLNAQVVDTQFGKIKGILDGNVYQFLGIPFAKPPVDSLRWKAPQNPELWSDTLKTLSFAPVCPQKLYSQTETESQIQGDEDCLYLNIWTPETGAGDRPVLVFIHGGGNQQGGASQNSGNTPMYSGKNMAERGNAVIVTIQYRLGPLGFLVHPGLDAENPNGVSGNYAVLDQIMALTWIKNNIEQFGGNPDKIMIFGESAGGVNVGNLMITPLAKGLFQRACIESASPVINNYQDSENKGISFVDNYISSGTDIEKIIYMRNVRADSLVKDESSPLQGGFVQMNWQPVLDNYIFHGFPRQIFQSGEYNKVPLIIGTNADEVSLTAPLSVTPAMVTTLIKSYVPAAYQATAFELYPPGTTSAEARQSYVDILTDAQFTISARRTAQCISLNQNEPVWRYLFSHKHSIQQLAEYGSYHGMELFYVFNTWENTILGSGIFFKPEDKAVEDFMLKYWVNFAETGNPNGDQLETWPQYDSATDCYLEINATSNGTQTGLRTEKCNLWDDISHYVICSASVNIHDSKAFNKIEVFPNPTDGQFRINILHDEITDIKVFDSAGQELNIRNVSNLIDLSNYRNGMYYLQVLTKDKIFTGKLIKK